jgi:hypothetical protein
VIGSSGCRRTARKRVAETSQAKSLRMAHPYARQVPVDSTRCNDAPRAAAMMDPADTRSALKHGILRACLHLAACRLDELDGGRVCRPLPQPVREERRPIRAILCAEVLRVSRRRPAVSAHGRILPRRGEARDAADQSVDRWHHLRCNLGWLSGIRLVL